MNAIESSNYKNVTTIDLEVASVYYPILIAKAKSRSDLLPTSRTKVMEQSPLISENSGYETIQIYR
jgi:hypothetical protein